MDDILPEIKLVDVGTIKSFIKKQKEIKPGSILPPTILVESKGNMDMIVCCPYQAEQVVKIIKDATNPDCITYVTESVMSIEFAENSKNLEDMQKLARQKYPKGIQEAKKNNDPNILDCLVAIRIDRLANTHDVIVMTFKFNESTNTIEWLKNELPIESFKVGGPLIQELKKIMMDCDPASVKINNILKEKAKEFGIPEEQARFHSARACMAFLLENNFFVVDMISCKHPEWCNSEEIANHIIGGMIENKYLVDDCKFDVVEFIRENLGKSNFFELFANYLLDNEFLGKKFEKLSKGKDEILKFMGLAIEDACLSPLGIAKITQNLQQKINNLPDTTGWKKTFKKENPGNWNDFFGGS